MGMPAARITDMHVWPMVTVLVPHVGGPILPPGAVTVLIGGLPAARLCSVARPCWWAETGDTGVEQRGPQSEPRPLGSDAVGVTAAISERVCGNRSLTVAALIGAA